MQRHQDRLVSRRSLLRVAGSGAIALGLTGGALLRPVGAQDEEDDVANEATLGTEGVAISAGDAAAVDPGLDAPAAAPAAVDPGVDVEQPDLTVPNVPEAPAPEVPQADMTVPNVPQPEPVAPQPEPVAAPQPAPQPQTTLPNTGVGSAVSGGLGAAAAGLLAAGAAAAAFVLRNTSSENSAEA